MKKRLTALPNRESFFRQPNSSFTSTTTFEGFPACRIHVSLVQGALLRAQWPSRNLRLRPSLVETTILHALRFIIRFFAVGSLLVILLVIGSLLQGELARAWAGEVRRVLKRNHS
jgi:hypothetical protein